MRRLPLRQSGSLALDGTLLQGAGLAFIFANLPSAYAVHASPGFLAMGMPCLFRRTDCEMRENDGCVSNSCKVAVHRRSERQRDTRRSLYQLVQTSFTGFCSENSSATFSKSIQHCTARGLPAERALDNILVDVFLAVWMCKHGLK